MPKFSVIIPVRSINSFLKENIEHLRQLDHCDFEVIIITDTVENYFLADSRFRFLASGSKGPGEKRNMGAAYALGDILAFLDDDAYPAVDWLKSAAEIFKSPAVYALGAPAITPPSVPLFEALSGDVLKSYFTGAGTIYRYMPLNRRFVNDYPSVNLFVRKQVFLEVGGFDINFWPGEDTKLCLDLVQRFGRNFVYDPSPIVYHHRRALFVPHLKQISRYGKHRGQFAKIFPETSRLLTYFIPAIFVCGLVLGPPFCLILPVLWEVYLGVLLVYLWGLVVESARLSLSSGNLRGLPYLVAGIFLTHIVYGVNFIYGFFKRPSLELRGVDVATGSYVGG